MRDSQNKLISLFKEYPFGVLLASLMLTIVGAPLATKFVAFIPGLHGQAAIAPLVLVLTLAAAYTISFESAQPRHLNLAWRARRRLPLS